MHQSKFSGELPLIAQRLMLLGECIQDYAKENNAFHDVYGDRAKECTVKQIKYGVSFISGSQLNSMSVDSNRYIGTLYQGSRSGTYSIDQELLEIAEERMQPVYSIKDTFHPSINGDSSPEILSTHDAFDTIDEFFDWCAQHSAKANQISLRK